MYMCVFVCTCKTEEYISIFKRWNLKREKKNVVVEKLGAVI